MPSFPRCARAYLEWVDAHQCNMLLFPIFPSPAACMPQRAPPSRPPPAASSAAAGSDQPAEPPSSIADEPLEYPANLHHLDFTSCGSLNWSVDHCAHALLHAAELFPCRTPLLCSSCVCSPGLSPSTHPFLRSPFPNRHLFDRVPPCCFCNRVPHPRVAAAVARAASAAAASASSSTALSPGPKSTSPTRFPAAASSSTSGPGPALPVGYLPHGVTGLSLDGCRQVDDATVTALLLGQIAVWEAEGPAWTLARRALGLQQPTPSAGTGEGGEEEMGEEGEGNGGTRNGKEIVGSGTAALSGVPERLLQKRAAGSEQYGPRRGCRMPARCAASPEGKIALMTRSITPRQSAYTNCELSASYRLPDSLPQRTPTSAPCRLPGAHA